MVKYKVLFNEKGFVNTTQERGGKNASDYRMNFFNTCDHCRVVQFKRLLLEGRDSVNVFLLPCCNSLNSDHVMIFIWEVTVVLLIHNGMQSVTCGKLHNWMVTWSEGCKHVSRIRPPAHTAEEFDLLCFLWVIKWEGRVRQKYMARGWWLQSHDKQRNGMRSTNDFPSNLT